jgi:hypothetical protein
MCESVLRFTPPLRQVSASANSGHLETNNVRYLAVELARLKGRESSEIASPRRMRDRFWQPPPPESERIGERYSLGSVCRSDMYDRRCA